MFIADARFLCWDRLSCMLTTMPVGIWVMRIADSVLLTCWPPAPCERMVSIRKSSLLMSTSTSSTSGSTANGVAHALHPVHAVFEFQLCKGAAATHLGDDFLEAAHGAFAGGDHLDLPALQACKTLIHPEQVAGEQGGLVAAGAGADFQDDVAIVHGVLGQ